MTSIKFEPQSSEFKSIPQLLILIPNIADKIIKNGADYILAVKANQEA
jgi:hypothetical protein